MKNNSKKNKDTKTDMSFLEHLEELRWHLIRSTMAVLILALAAFLFKGFIFDNIIFGPSQTDFPTYRAFCKISQSFGMNSFCFEEMPFRFQNLNMMGQFSAHIWTSIYAGIILGFPYILYELWRFIAPGLKKSERRSSRGFIFVASLLFFLGVLFGYYMVAPLSVTFFGTYQVSATVINDFELGSYIAMVRTSVLASGIMFELPIIVYILTKIGLLTPEILRKYRKIAIVLILVLSAIITPPDVASQVIVSIPIVILYEVSIFISKMVIKKEKREAHERSR